MKTTLPFFLVAALTATVSLHAQTFNPTTEAKGFNIFLQSNLTATGGNVEGSVALGADLFLNGNTTFAMNSSGTYPSGVLNQSTNYGMVIGEKISFTSGNSSQLNQGLLRMGNTAGARLFYTDCNNAGTNLKVTPYKADCNQAFNGYPQLVLQRQQANGSATTPHNLDFKSAFTNFQQHSALIHSFNSSGSAEFNKITIPSGSNPHINLQENKINYINLTPAQLNNLVSSGSVIFDNKPGATRPLVFNIAGTGDINWNTANFGGLGNSESAYILWNFYGANALTIGGNHPVFGTLFAPSAVVTKSNGNNLYGQIIAKSLTLQAGLIAYYPFQGRFSNSVQSQSVLPVKLLSFAGTVAGGKAELQWNVAQNETCRLAEVEKSTNGIEFKTAGVVFASEKTGNESYRFKEALTGKTYYRLKLVDNSNSISYSTVLALLPGTETNNVLKVLQNPIYEALAFQLTSSAAGEAEVLLMEANGRVVFQTTKPVVKGSNLFSFAIGSQLARGFYFLRIKTGESKTTAKLLK